MAGKKYLDLIRYAYPISNVAYVIAVNNEVLDSEGLPPNPNVDIESGLEPTTKVILEQAGLFNLANKRVR